MAPGFNAEFKSQREFGTDMEHVDLISCALDHCVQIKIYK